MALGSAKGSAGRRQREWLVPVAVLAIAFLTAFVVERLYESAHRRHDAQIRLAQIEEEVNEQQLGEYEALVEGEVTPEVSDGIARSRADIELALDALGGGHGELARIGELLSAGESAMDEELRLIEEGRLDEAKAIDEERVDPAFEELREVLESADAGYEGYAGRVDLLADVGGYAVASLAILLTAWSVRRDRNRRAEQAAIEESEERFRSLVQEGADLIWLLDPDGTVRYAAPSVERVLGHAGADVVGRDVFEFLVPADEGAERGIRGVLGEPGAKITRELRARRADGSRALFEATFGNMTANPRVGGIVVNGRDVTERREAEEVLRDSEERYRALYEDNPSMYFTLDAEGTVLSVNTFGAGQLGHTTAELVGGSVLDVFHQEDREAARERLAECLRNPTSISQWEIRKVRKDGSVMWVRENARAVRGPDGKTVVLVNCEDVTERKEAEALLRRRGAAMEAAVNGIAILDADGTFTYANDAHAKVYGYSDAGELVGQKTWRDLYDEEQLAWFDRHAVPTIGRQGYWRGEAVGRRGDGSPFPQELSISLLEDGGFVCIVQDVTERKEAEAEIRRLNEDLEGRVRERTAQLRASEARLRALFAAMTDVILVLDAQGRCLEVAPTGPSLLYRPPEEIVGKTLHEVFPRDRADEFMDRIRLSLESRRTVGLEYSLTIEGREVWFHGTVSPMQEDSVLFVARDVTERKRAEEDLRSYARKLAQSNGELQSFAYVASHDLQEPLRKVRTFGDRLRTKYSGVLDTRALDYLDRMEGATARMQDLIDDLLTLSRVTTKARPFAPVDLGEVVGEVLSDLEASVEQAAGRVEVGELPTIEADRMQMRQLLQNLLGNALKFHKDGEPPVVRVRGEVVRGEAGHGGRALCQILVEDDGIGFEEEHAERIFAPFERLHGRGAYEGTGMGLAICRKVVERHGGEIQARSTAGRGAAFVVTLPVEQGVKEAPEQGDGAHDYAAAGR